MAVLNVLEVLLVALSCKHTRHSPARLSLVRQAANRSQVTKLGK